LRRAPGPPYVEISEVPLVKGSEDVGTVHLLHDVTESRRIERELREVSESAQQAARVQSEFLANMSHEIRTPLTGILGLSRLMADETAPAETGVHSQLRYAALVRDSAETLQSIADDILDLSKIESGLMRIAPQPVQAPRLVEETLALFAEAAHRQSLTLEARVPADFPAWVMADGLRVRQLLHNLVNNAIKFTPAGSVTVSLEHAADIWMVTVTDTGVGIDPALTDSLFERFIQADASLARRFGGTGLGLPISQKLVELMGGEIGVGS